MEPVTHILTGACLARAGLNRRAAYATAAMAIAAEFPDIDTLWGLRGPISGFQHHRGITHTFLGIPFEAGILLVSFWLFHRWRTRRSSPNSQKSPSRAHPAPVRWTALYGFLILALLSHLLLDFTNNYGIRPFFPFNSHWYAASIIFIFDPLLFLVLGAGLLLPAIFALVGQEVGARRQAFRGAGWARAALVAIAVLWLVRTYEHATAVSLANAQIFEIPTAASTTSEPEPSPNPDLSPTPKPPHRRETLTPASVVASPDPLSIFRWYTATDFGPAYQLGTADTRAGALAVTETLAKPSPNLFLQAARHTRLGQVYLDWSAMPWLSSGEATSSDPGDTEVTVLFEDLRFMGATPLLRRRRTPPLTGVVVLSRTGEVLEQGIDGRFEH